jgi:hypothetical protein
MMTQHEQEEHEIIEAISKSQVEEAKSPLIEKENS